MAIKVKRGRVTHLRNDAASEDVPAGKLVTMCGKTYDLVNENEEPATCEVCVANDMPLLTTRQIQIIWSSTPYALKKGCPVNINRRGGYRAEAYAKRAGLIKRNENEGEYRATERLAVLSDTLQRYNEYNGPVASDDGLIHLARSKRYDSRLMNSKQAECGKIAINFINSIHGLPDTLTMFRPRRASFKQIVQFVETLCAREDTVTCMRCLMVRHELDPKKTFPF